MSFDFLRICLRDRAITAQSVEDYAALGDMAHGAILALGAGHAEVPFLVQVRDEARELERIAFSRRWA